ncbi:MAG: hypothetical protein ACJ76R_10415 [Solirubrobacteraceae bacterium]
MPVPVLGIDLPARLILRALDDLHAIAQAARTLPDVEARLAQRIDELESRATEVLDAVSTAEATLGDGIAVGRPPAARVARYPGPPWPSEPPSRGARASRCRPW